MQKDAYSATFVRIQNVDNLTPPNPHHIVLALRALLNVSRDKAGPTDEQAAEATSGLAVSPEWLLAILTGWRRFATTYDRPFASELVQKGPVRFLRANTLPDFRFEESDRICRLCGFACQPPARLWHKDCWSQFEPSTAKGWKRITKEAMKRAGNCCEACQVNLKDLNKANPEPWRRVYDVDHRIPLFKGGSHSIDNVQILCRACHLAKTANDLTKVSKPDIEDEGSYDNETDASRESP